MNSSSSLELHLLRGRESVITDCLMDEGLPRQALRVETDISSKRL